MSKLQLKIITPESIWCASFTNCLFFVFQCYCLNKNHPWESACTPHISWNIWLNATWIHVVRWPQTWNSVISESAPSAATYRSTTQGKSGSDSKGKGSSAVIISDALEAISLKLKLSAVVGKRYQGNDFADMTLTKRSGRKQETEYPGEKENLSKTDTSWQ